MVLLTMTVLIGGVFTIAVIASERHFDPLRRRKG